MDYLKLITTARDQVIGAKALKVWRFLLGVVLALLLAQTSAALTWKIASLVSAPGESVVTRPGNGNKPAILPGISGTTRVALLTEELSLFGEAGKVERSSPSSALDAKAVPETTLELLLKGIITADPSFRALAIIAEKAKKDDEKVYGIGDKVPGNAEISEILADRIILRRGGVFETLMLLNTELTDPVNNRKDTEISSAAIVDLGDGVHWKIDNAYLEERLGDISSLAREVGVEVYKEGNVQRGYRLVSARGSKLLRDMGLQPGDILHEVNGVQLDTIHAGLSVYQNLRNNPNVQVVISRNGRRETRIYEIGSGG